MIAGGIAVVSSRYTLYITAMQKIRCAVSEIEKRRRLLRRKCREIFPPRLSMMVWFASVTTSNFKNVSSNGPIWGCWKVWIYSGMILKSSQIAWKPSVKNLNGTCYKLGVTKCFRRVNHARTTFRSPYACAHLKQLRSIMALRYNLDTAISVIPKDKIELPFFHAMTGYHRTMTESHV